MTRLRAAFVAAAAVPTFVLATVTGVGAVDLDTYAIIAASTTTNVGASVINGNIALYPGLSTPGYGDATVNGTIYIGSTVEAPIAQSDLLIQYNSLYIRPATQTLAAELGGTTLVAGVYNLSSAAGITGDLTLNGQGDPNSLFIFKIGSSLTTATASRVVLENGANGDNVYFLVGSDATLGNGSLFNGKIIAYSSITIGTTVTITCGAAWARTGAVTLAGLATITAPDYATDSCGVVTASADEGLDDDASDTAGDVGGALDDTGGPLPAAFQNILDTLTGPALAAALEQLSGQAGTGAAAAGSQSMNSFLSNLFDSAFADDSGGPGSAGPGNTGPSPATVKTLGYVSEDQVAQNGAVAALAPYGKPMRDPSRWSVWASAYGGHGTTNGDASAGTHTLSADNYGFAAGFGRDVTSRTKVGFALGGGGTSFGLADGFGSGSSGLVQAAVYSRTNVGQAYFATALAYAYHSVSTSRNVFLLAPPVNDTYTASYGAHNVAAEIEAGYHMGWITPYAALRTGAYFTPAYSESGPGAFGLSYAARTATSLRSELGARVARTILLRDRATTFTIKGRAAWAHDYLGSQPISTGFQQIPDATFDVSGAEPARDWLLLSAGAEFALQNGFAFGGTFDSAFAQNSQNWTARGVLAIAGRMPRASGQS